MITLIAGPMKSGKSTELFRQMERKHIAGKKVLYVCPSLDTREFFARGIPRSRLFEVASCETVKDWNLVDEKKLYDWIDGYDAIFVDEFFMIKNNIRLCTILPADDHKCDIFFGGLIADASAGMWGELIEIEPYCDEIIKLTAVCERCGSEHANFSYMKNVSQNAIVIGDAEYKALCRRCYLKTREEDKWN